MSFGFSVGDLITCSKLAFSTYHALRSAPSEFRSLSLEVQALSSTLKALEEEANSPYSIILSVSGERQESLRFLLEGLTNNLQKLRYLVLRYGRLEDAGKRSLREHVGWVTKDKHGPRERLTVHISSLNIFLTSLTHSSLGRLEALVRGVVAGGGGDKGLSLGSTGVQTREKDRFLEGWKNMGSNLFLLGMRVNDMETFGSHIEKYALHLSRGGKPFELSVGRQFQSAKPVSDPPVLKKAGKRRGAMRSEKEREEHRRLIEESLMRKGTREDSETEESPEWRKREEERYAARKKYEEELQRKLQAEARDVERKEKERLEEPKKLAEKPFNKKQLKKKKYKPLYFSLPQEKDEVESSAYAPNRAATSSPNDRDEADKLAEIFDQLFELDDHVLHGQLSPSPSPSLSATHTSNTEFKILAEASPRRHSPASSPSVAPSDIEEEPEEVPSPDDPSAKYDLGDPMQLPAQVFRATSAGADSSGQSAGVPVAAFDVAVKLNARLLRLYSARRAGDGHLVTDLTLYAIPDSVAWLRSFNVPILTCNNCALPIRKGYLLCSGCESVRICDECLLPTVVGGIGRKEPHLIEHPEHCRGKAMGQKSARDEDLTYWSNLVEGLDGSPDGGK